MTNEQKRRQIARKKKLRRRRKQRRAILMLLVIVALLVLGFSLLKDGDRDAVNEPETLPVEIDAPTPEAAVEPTMEPAVEVTLAPTPVPTPDPTPEPTPEPTLPPEEITLTFVGDCTLGGDMKGPSEGAFFSRVSASGEIDYEYCFRNVRSIFEEDDYTVVNLEVVLTNSSNYNTSIPGKIYIFRGKPSYVKMLTSSSVELANIANNHMTDFSEAGIEETISYLEKENIGYFGYGRTWYEEIHGMTVGFVGINTWTTKTEDMRATIKEVRANSDICIVNCHWGSELVYEATQTQKDIAHMAVDLGADLVIGHHPHVVNGIEVYKGVNIIYSLGNFCFGGKANPKDKDTFIYQHTFTVQNGEVLGEDFDIIPCKITSVPDESYNNYQPTPVTGEKAQAIFSKIYRYSKVFPETISFKRFQEEE